MIYMFDYDAYTSIELVAHTWDVQFYILSDDEVALAPHEFVPAIQRARPMSVPHVRIWPPGGPGGGGGHGGGGGGAGRARGAGRGRRGRSGAPRGGGGGRSTGFPAHGAAAEEDAAAHPFVAGDVDEGEAPLDPIADFDEGATSDVAPDEHPDELLIPQDLQDSGGGGGSARAFHVNKQH